MKKLILLLIIILTSSFTGFGQISSENTRKGSVNKGKNAKTERVKFDPTRNPAVDLQEAIAVAQKQKKRIILDVGGEWCGWCIQMDKFFLKNPKLAKLRDNNFIWIKVNHSEENENSGFLANYPEISGYPHLFVLDENGKFLHSQGTAPLESGESYNLPIFTEFLKLWSPKKK